MKVECDVYLIGVEQHVQKTSERLRKTQYNMVECGLREVEGWRTGCLQPCTNYWLYDLGPVVYLLSPLICTTGCGK